MTKRTILKNKRKIIFSAVCILIIAAFFTQSIFSGTLNAPEHFAAVGSADFSVTNLSGQVEHLSDRQLKTSGEKPGFSKNDEISVIIKMDDSPIIERFSKERYASAKDYAASYSGKEYVKFLEGRQNGLKALLSSKFDIEYQYSYTTIFNGFSAKIKYGDLKNLRNTTGVKSAFISETYNAPESANLPFAAGGASDRVTNDVHVYDTGIYNSSDVPFDGTGTVVAILDTGLDYTHPAFRHIPSEFALTKNSVANILSQTSVMYDHPEITVDDVYLSGKVPFAYDYADHKADVYPKELHGTHVAGIVAGLDDLSYKNEEGDYEVFRGVAPGAQLAIFKVFSNSTQTAGMTDILVALGDAVLLNVDVINMSLGSTAGFSSEDDSEGTDEIYESIREAGISLMVSAGNEGSSASGSTKGSTNLLTNPDSGTMSSPSTYAASMAIASINGKLSDYLIANGETTAYMTEAVDLNNKNVPFVSVLLNGRASAEFEYVTVPGFGRSTNYAPVNVKGKIALVRRGSINFKDKIINAYDAGAIGIIIYNNISGEIAMSIERATMIPSCSITMDAGEILAKKASGTILLNSEFKAGPFISSFSSWGVSPSLDLKPEITAHGGNIISSVPGGYDVMSGTSMAAPNIAGAITIVRQYLKNKYPDMSATEISTLANRLFMSTATVARNENGNPYSPRKQGAGLASIYNTVNTDAYLYVDGIDKTKLSLGDDKNKTGAYSLKFNLKNMDNPAKSYRIETDTFTETMSSDLRTVAEKAYMLNNGSVTVSATNAFVNGNIISVGAFQDASITVNITLTEEEKQYIDKTFANGMFVEGFVRLVPLDSEISLSIPWVSFYGDWTVAPMFDVTAYEVGDSHRNTAVPDADKLEPDVYGSIPMGGFYGPGNQMYYWGLGDYLYVLEDDTQKPYAKEDKAALSESEDGIFELSYVGLGALRGAKYADTEIINTTTGQVVFSSSQNNIRKSTYTSGMWRPGAVNVDLKAYDKMFANNTKYEISVKGKLDYGDGGVDTNLNNTYKSSFYIDSEAPELLTDRLALRIEEKNNTKRYYLDMYLYDNHYLQAMLMCTYKEIVNNAAQGITYFDNYMIPVESEFNSVTKFSYEITTYWEEIRANGDKVYIEMVDFAKNTSVYNIQLPHKAAEGASFKNNVTSKNLAINQTVDLKEELVLTPDDAWKFGLDWSTSNSGIATVDNGVVTGVSQGKCTITATATNAAGGKTTASIEVNVSDTVYTPALEKLVMNLQAIKGAVGEEGLLTVNVTPWNFTPNLVWQSSNSKIVSITKIDGTNQARYKILEATTNTVSITVTDANSSALIRGNCSFSVRLAFDVDNGNLKSYRGRGTTVNGEENVVKFPEGQNDLNVTTIGYASFQGNEYIRKVIIPEGVTIIRSNAFDSCVNLREVVLPASCEIIEDFAFSGCEKLTTINLGGVEKTVGGVKIKEGGVKTIYPGAFYGTALNFVDLSKTFFVGSYAFYSSGPFSEVDLLNVKFIGEYAFANCYNLQEATIAATVISEGAFGANLRLKSVTFLNKVRIENGAFEMCQALQEVYFNKGCTSIGSLAFAYCMKLKEIYLPDELEIVGSEAFLMCTALQRVIISANARIKVFGANAFKETIVDKFEVESGNMYLTEVDGVLLDINKTKLVMFPNAKTPQYILSGTTYNNYYQVPATVLNIGAYAFSGNPNLERIYLNNTQTVEDGAFLACESLSRIVFTSRQKYLGNNAFRDCPKLELAYLSSGQTTHTLLAATSLSHIGNYAFYITEDNTSVEHKLSLPASVSYIGDSAFTGRKNITSADLSNLTNLERLSGYVFRGCIGLKEVILPEGMVSVGEGAFSECLMLSSVTIPNSVTEFGTGVFSYCGSLESITLPENIKEIAFGMFYYSALKNIELPAAVETINALSFTGCYEFTGFTGIGLTNVKYINGSFSDVAGAFSFTKIVELDIPNVEHLGAYLFTGYDPIAQDYLKNDTLKKINAPKVTNIAPYAFLDCTALNEVLIGKVQNIGYGAFESCESLSSILLPVVREIGSNAFYGTAIKTITLPSSLEILGEAAFSNITQFESISVDSGNNLFFTDGGVLYSKLPGGGYQLEQYPQLKTGSTYTILEGTKRVAAFAFIGNSGLTKVTLPRTLKSVGNGAFYNTNISVYEFKSPVMPILESYLNIVAVEGSLKYVLYYCNFTAYIKEVSGLEIIHPSNGTGYDNEIVKRFFETFTLSSIAALDTTVNVIDLINLISDTVSINDKEKIETARLYYDLLLNVQKQLVTNYSKLTAAESSLAGILKSIQDAKIAEVTGIINNFPANISASDKDAVFAAMDKYSALTEEEKALVLNKDKLFTAVSEIQKIEEANKQGNTKKGCSNNASAEGMLWVLLTLSLAVFAKRRGR